MFTPIMPLPNCAIALAVSVIPIVETVKFFQRRLGRGKKKQVK